MAVYGIDFYGVGRFGRDPALIRPDFSVDPFKSSPLDYSTLHLTWAKPGSIDCLYLRLVRNPRNLSQIPGQPPGTTTDANAQADGEVLFTDTVNRPQAITDTGLGSGFHYYTMWGWSNLEQQWIRCTDLIGLVPINWGYGWRYYNLLPATYRDRDYVLVDPYNPWPVDSPTPPLQRYLQLIGFQTDFIRTELESLMSINDAQNCSGALLPLMAQQFALPHEPEIGMQQERILIQNAIHLYKLKGSPRGITEFTSIMTSYPASSLVHHGYNCMLTVDDSAMLDGIGTWQAWPPAGSNFTPIEGNTGLTLAQATNLTNPMKYYPGLSTPGAPTWPYNATGMQVTSGNGLNATNGNFANGALGSWSPNNTNTKVDTSNVQAQSGTHSMRLTSLAAGAVSAVVKSQVINNITTPIPVSAGDHYTLTGYFRPNVATTLRGCTATITFVNSNGTVLATAISPSVTEVANAWVQAAVPSTVAPAGAVAATIIVTVAGTAAANEVHYVDNLVLLAVTQDLTFTTGPIPITDFMSQTYGPGGVTFRIQVWSPVARQVYLSVWGDAGTGTPVQIVAPTVFTSRVGDWQLMTVYGVVNPYPQKLPTANAPTGPASYYWIYPRVRIAGVPSNESHIVTLAGVWSCEPGQIGIDTPAYDYPRDVKVVLQPQAANLLSNTVTTFSYLGINPSPPPALTQIGMGFDGLTCAYDPMVPTGAPSGTMQVRYESLEDVPGTVAVNGPAALQMTVNQTNGVIWFGQVQQWSAPPPSPLGWMAGPGPNTYKDGLHNDWYPGAVPGSATARDWVDPDMNQETSWFTVPLPSTQPPNPGPPSGSFFGIGADFVNGVWFPLPPQPPQKGNLVPFNVENAQPFNFSVYARYVSVVDPSNAVMEQGFRWYYPDGTWAETSTFNTITDVYTRYSVAPTNGPFNLGEPPPQALTGILPIFVFPYVRFTQATAAQFLLNSAMLSPTVTMPVNYMDATSLSSATGDFIQDTGGASYFYQRRTPRIARLTSELYRWLPMGSTYTINYSSGAIMPPLDPTLWPPAPGIILVGTSSMNATPS